MMTTLQLTLSDDLKARAEARAAAAGHRSLEQYVESLIQADTVDDDADGEDFGAPPHLTVDGEAELDAKLLDRLESPGPTIEATPEFWAQLTEKMRARSNGGGGR